MKKLELNNKVLVVGANGNMGSRYSAILKTLEKEVVKIDIGDFIPKGIKKAIIATSTKSHYQNILGCIGNGYTHILCEKPVSMDLDELTKIKELVDHAEIDFRMVCNWTFTTPIKFRPNSCTINYDCWRTGNDGLYPDTIQLVHLARSTKKEDLLINNKSPIFHCCINGIEISLTDIDRSYLAMILTWLNTPEDLWDLNDAISSTRKVLKVVEERTKK